MIFITARFFVKPEYTDRWLEIVNDFTEATRAEDGCLWFEWARSARNPDEYFVIEAFKDEQAGVEHVRSDHFAAATAKFPNYLSRTPQVINVSVDQGDWSDLGEMAVVEG